MLKKKILAAALAVVMLLGLVGCKESGIDDLSQNLTTYSIDLTYDGDRTVNASMQVRYVNNYDVELGELMFHLYPAAYREGAKYCPIEERDKASAYPQGVNYGGIEISKVTCGEKEIAATVGGEDEDILIVPIDKLKPTGNVTVGIDFTLTLPEVRHRFGKCGTTVNLGNFYPIACLYREGAFVTDPYYAIGDPFYSAPANYTVKLTVPHGLTVATTGASATETGETHTTVTATAKAVRDFAAVVGEFQVTTAKSNDTEVRYYYATDSDPSKSLQAAVDSLDVFSEKYGRYPYSTYSVVETAFLQGGMEYPQIVFISDALAPEVYRDAIIHETAHQWFYGLVGNDQVKNPWLDEALAEYSASLFYKWRPDYQIEFEKRISDALGSFILYCELYKHGGKDDTSMRSVDAYADNMEYTYMTYVKGELMLDSLRRTIGDGAFETALKNYVTDNYLTFAQPDDLICCFEKASGKELKSFFDSWVSGKVMLFA